VLFHGLLRAAGLLRRRASVRDVRAPGCRVVNDE
jgi:hypothetical protein